MVKSVSLHCLGLGVQAQGLTLGIFTWALWMELRLCGSTFPRHVFTEGAAYLGTAENLPAPGTAKALPTEDCPGAAIAKEGSESQVLASAPRHLN